MRSCVQLFPIAKKLADCVIGAEYGIYPEYKTRIASKIARELIGKLAVDLSNVLQESLASAPLADDCFESDGLLHGSPEEMETSLVRPHSRTVTLSHHQPPAASHQGTVLRLIANDRAVAASQCCRCVTVLPLRDSAAAEAECTQQERTQKGQVRCKPCCSGSNDRLSVHRGAGCCCLCRLQATPAAVLPLTVQSALSRRRRHMRCLPWPSTQANIMRRVLTHPEYSTSPEHVNVCVSQAKDWVYTLLSCAHWQVCFSQLPHPRVWVRTCRSR